ncbi:silicon transporter-domain-containing protein [Ochromonadaceae sp. CCMP2298]|nr:silicon transporter-domain-containing protein [Ochromonadaceae sp. CCMP2298]
MSTAIGTMNSFCRSSPCENVKLVVSSALVTLLIFVLIIGVSLTWCVLKIHPAANFLLLIGAITLLAYVEALHYACVAIEKWDMDQYKERFPRAVKCHALVDTPDKVKKFLVGRQFFVIFVVFLIAQITSFEGLPSILVLIFIQTGLPGIALTLNVGQLISQIYVEEFTLQFMNIYGCEFVIRLSLFAEWIGICNFSWLLYGVVSRIACKKVRRIQKTLDADNLRSTDDLNEPTSPHTANRGPDFDTGLTRKEPLTLFDYAKYIWSTAVTLGSVVVVLYGISIEAYVLPIPAGAAYIVALILLTTLYYLEGLMIAIVGTQYWDPETFRTVYPRAYKVHAMMSEPDNVKRFIIGRQFFTLLTNFFLAQILVFANWKSGSYNPVLFFLVIKSGLVGVMIILAFAQLLPELLAAEFPLRFMNMYGSGAICNMCMVFDAIGVGHFAWALYFVTRKMICGSQMSGDTVVEGTKPTLVIVASAEVLAKTKKLAVRNPDHSTV